jgi:hypothetical protein
MYLQLTLYIALLVILGISPTGSYANDNRVLLAPVDKYSYCTPYTPYGNVSYSLGVIGTDWALTFELQVDSLSGEHHVKNARFYRGPNMHIYIGKSAGPRRPPIPKTKAYTVIELTGINVDIHRVKIYDKMMGPIEMTVDDFTVNRKQFHIPSKINMACFGPLP